MVRFQVAPASEPFAALLACVRLVFGVLQPQPMPFEVMRVRERFAARLTLERHAFVHDAQVRPQRVSVRVRLAALFAHERPLDTV